ncbi:hypothetical protein H8K32_14440 [Undibacterium jejuense]|uniref:Uncharacterized protein n=1 Tax=Undibacterium jejuense TaxID=1344949 RepID=A0A923HEY3_9BURK|nr:hypothetical protein [Undibacterium jejuense]MBC3863302.1 hypothetical protein [Undibacterium jejuense]
MNTIKKTDKKLTGLPKLKNQLWLASVIERSQQVSLEQTLYWLYQKGLEGDSNKWYRYSACSSKPRPELISEVDKILPGTAKIYRSGSERFPLFLVLDKNEGVCKRVVSSLLADAQLYRSGQTLTEKCHTLFQHIAEIDFQQAWCRPHYDFEKLLAEPTANAIGESIKIQNLSSRTMLAIIALWNVTILQNDIIATNCAEYLMFGILGAPMEENFGKPVAEFVSEMFHMAG